MQLAVPSTQAAPSLDTHLRPESDPSSNCDPSPTTADPQDFIRAVSAMNTRVRLKLGLPPRERAGDMLTVALASHTYHLGRYLRPDPDRNPNLTIHLPWTGSGIGK